MRLIMPSASTASNTLRRLGTTISMRSDLKIAARETARKAGLPLSRYIESLIIHEVHATTSGPVSNPCPTLSSRPLPSNPA